MIVVAGGQAYVIEPEERSLRTTFGGQIDTALAVSAANVLVLSNAVYLEEWNTNTMQWRTRRISWDGIRDLCVDQDRLKGLAWNAVEGCGEPFSVDLKTDKVEGGARDAF
jgi:hypothetical protein